MELIVTWSTACSITERFYFYGRRYTVYATWRIMSDLLWDFSTTKAYAFCVQFPLSRDSSVASREPSI
jgi:hypothetical protein